jgi:hypothetical protein
MPGNMLFVDGDSFTAHGEAVAKNAGGSLVEGGVS